MADDLRQLDGEFWQHEWPSVPCPECKTGDLVAEEDAIADVMATASVRAQDDPDWDPEWIFGYFHGVLICNRGSCREKVVVVGEYRVLPVDNEQAQSPGLLWGSYYRLSYTIPPLPIVLIPAGAPEEVRARVTEASRVIWTDPGAAANRLRLAIEELLNKLRIKKTTISKRGNRVRLNTHDRILLLKQKNVRAGETLEAVKWIGNQGSHDGGKLTATDVLDGAELLAYALKLLYDTTEVDIARRVKAINKSKGLRRRGGPKV